MADPFTLGVIAAVPVAIVGGATAAAAKIRKHHRKRIGTNVQKNHNFILREDVQKRLEEESSTAHGEPVWISRRTEQGQIKHWVLITYGRKYELRLVRPGDAAGAQGGYIPDASNSTSVSGLGSRHYRFDIVEDTKINITHERRRLALTEQVVPAWDGNTISLVGWTRRSSAEVDAMARNEGRKFGKYSVVTNNCQDLLISIARNIVTTRARDWEWITQHRLSRYRRNYEYVAPMGTTALYSAAACQLENMEHMRGTAVGNEAAMLEHNISILQEYCDAMAEQAAKEMATDQQRQGELSKITGAAIMGLGSGVVG